MRYWLTIFLIFFVACSGQQITKECQHEKSKYSSKKELGKLLKNQSQGLSSETIYIVFSADWCNICIRLHHLLQDAGISKKVIFVDVEKTWGFLFSQEMGISGVPSLAVINSNKTIQIREGINKIVTYLVSHLDSKKKKIELIQK